MACTCLIGRSGVEIGPCRLTPRPGLKLEGSLAPGSLAPGERGGGNRDGTPLPCCRFLGQEYRPRSGVSNDNLFGWVFSIYKYQRRPPVHELKLRTLANQKLSKQAEQM